MAKIILFLLLLTIKSNAYAELENYWWSCTWVWSTNFGWHCIQNYSPPVCTNTVEYQTLSCPIHQSGSINQSRTYNCSTQAWSSWTTTSNNCTQDPPTCVSSTETRQIACAAGYTGFIQEQRSSICSDPYGSPTWTAWLEMSNTCKMTIDNVNNVTSPISPISPLNPNSVINQQVTTAPVIQTEPVIAQDLTASTTTATTQSSTSKESTTQSTSSSTTTTSVTEKVPEAPKGKEIVPGFGIVMSMQLLNQGYNMQQQQIQEYIFLEQENEYGRTQDFTLSLLSETAVGDRFDFLNRSRWANLLRNNALQRLEWGD